MSEVITSQATTTTGEILGTGRRKTAVARVRLRAGEGKLLINERSLEDYFPSVRYRDAVLAPLEQSGKRSAVDILIRVDGGGLTGQADACKLGIARALKKFDDSLDTNLRHSGLLTRDSRMKERKKYGLRGARRGTQFSKR
jgi:small subunit ribosomal protein S9